MYSDVGDIPISHSKKYFEVAMKMIGLWNEQIWFGVWGCHFQETFDA